jgi:hypothetical protein
MPGTTNTRSGGVRGTRKVGDPRALPFGSAMLATDVTRSLRTFNDMQKSLSFITGPSSLLALKRDTLPVLDITRQYQGVSGTSNILAATLGPKNFLQEIMAANKTVADITSVHKFAVGLADAFPASSLVAQLPRRPLSSRTFVSQLPRIGGITSEPLLLRELGALKRVQMPLIQPLSSVFSFVDEFEESWRFFEVVDAVARVWEGHALWFIISSLPLGDWRMLADLDREQVEEVILRALEAVVADGKFVAALRAVLGEAPLISAFQRENLLHGLELAEKREYVIAVTPLTIGLEGALYSAARDRQVIDAERMLLNKPGKRAHSVEQVVREMELDHEYSKFLYGRIFGTRGNFFRHGDSDGGERRQALLAVVALSGWIDTFMGLSARSVLVELMSDELSGIVEYIDQPVLEAA